MIALGRISTHNYLFPSLRRKIYLNYFIENIERGKKGDFEEKNVLRYPVEKWALIRILFFMILFTS